MHWLDSVLATPVIGLQVQPDFVRLPGYPQALGPLLDRLFQELGEIRISNEQALSFVFWTKDGFQHKVLSTDVIVEYNYPFAAQAKPGALPTLEKQEVEHYSLLLERTEARLDEIVNAIATDGRLAVTRVGIVAATRLKKEDLPPGIKTLIAHIAKPWGNLLKSQSTLLAKLTEQDKLREQCHHTINFDEVANPGAVGLTLDWQRAFSEARPLGADQLLDEVRSCRKAALRYFEQVGAGELSYE